MFFLRCAFFLSIVYVGIGFGVGFQRSPHDFGAAVANATAGVADAVVAHATDWCADRPAQCVRDAARLTALVQTAAIEPTAEAEDVAVFKPEAPRPPMPVPDPRRRATRAVLTDAR